MMGFCLSNTVEGGRMKRTTDRGVKETHVTVLFVQVVGALVGAAVMAHILTCSVSPPYSQLVTVDAISR